MLALAREREDSEGIFFALLNLGVLSDELGTSEVFFEEAARIARDPTSSDGFREITAEEGLGLINVNLGNRRLLAGSYEDALALSEQGAQL